MSSHNEQVEPTPFDVVPPTPVESISTATSRRREGTPVWVLPALGGLLLLAVLVIFWLPERFSTPAPEPENPAQAAPGQGAQTAAGAATGQAKVAGPDVSPWSDAQQAKLRKEAQDVLAQLLDVQEVLEERGVQLWAPEQFGAVGVLATAGDELYRNRDYPAAKARYEEGLTQLLALEASLPVALARQLALAGDALEAGDLAAASGALDKADALDPGNAEAAALRQRVAVLPELLTLLDSARAAEQEGELAAAIALLEQAVALDSAHQRSGNELARVKTAWQEQRFNEAMSEGYEALDANRFDTARAAFRKAAQLQAGSSEAASALQEVATAATAHRLGELQRKGARDEQSEQWQQAVTAYEQAQKIDPNVLFAREGLDRSRERARLDKQFRAAIDDPQRLGDVAVSRATTRMLELARNITPRGPLLDAQIEQLERLLKQANTPINVTLRSDLQTDVIVYKVAKLGKFDQHELNLRPGTYTAVGSRIGYRDVRLDFNVNPEGTAPVITIVCTETIQ